MSASSTTVNFNLKDAGYANFASQTITFTLKNVGADVSATDSPVIGRGSVSTTSDASGNGSLTVFNTGSSDTGTSYDITLPGGEHVEVIIPSSAVGGSIELSTLLKDNQVDATPVTTSVYDAARNRANHSGDLSLDSLPGGAITGTLAIANGGTNASSASAARTNLDAQQQQDVLDDLGALSAPSSDGEFIVATGAGAFQYESGSTVRTSLGLGTIATQASNSVDIDGGAIDGTVIGANSAAAGTFAAGTFTSISVSDGDITNAGDVNCDEVSVDDATVGLNVNFNGNTGTNKISLTDNLASALDVTESSNSYLKFVTTNSGEKIVFGKDVDVSGDHDIIIGTSTGTKIGTATSQKIGFFNATPVVQQNGTGETSGITGGSGTTVHTNATFTGNVGSTAYTINDIVKALKNLGLLAQ
jgi:hypothetical protein